MKKFDYLFVGYKTKQIYQSHKESTLVAKIWRRDKNLVSEEIFTNTYPYSDPAKVWYYYNFMEYFHFLTYYM